MQITNLNKIFRPPDPDREISLRREREKSPTRPSRASILVDTVEISPESREKRLELIKKRVKTGFYASSSVTDDISDKLSKYFDKASDK